MKARRKNRTRHNYTSIFWAWVLSCLVFSAGFDSLSTFDEASITNRAPLAHFSHSDSNYSLRFNGLRLFASDSDDNGDDKELNELVSISANITRLFVTSLYTDDLHIEAFTRFYLHVVRGPPLTLK